jgi:Icc-related predicted phosphoesterase
MRVAVVGDVHGHLALMYAILGRWQQETGRRIDLILQVGDLGSFVPGSRLDQATRRFADRDPEELGFAEFAGDDQPPTLLDPRPPMIFIPGNHEDFDYLHACERRAPAESPVYPVAEDGRISALRSGATWTFALGDERLRVGGVSGVANYREKRGRHARVHLAEDEAMALASAGRGGFDVLISHERPDHIWPSFRDGASGSAAIRLVIEEVQPAFAFFGHYNRPGEWPVGTTRVIGLADCGYVEAGHWPVAEGGLGVFEWGSEPSFERVWPEWLRESTRSTWGRWGRT